MSSDIEGEDMPEWMAAVDALIGNTDNLNQPEEIKATMDKIVEMIANPELTSSKDNEVYGERTEVSTQTGDDTNGGGTVIESNYPDARLMAELEDIMNSDQENDDGDDEDSEVETSLSVQVVEEDEETKDESQKQELPRKQSPRSINRLNALNKGFGFIF